MGSLRNELIAYRIMGQFRIASHSHLGQDAGTVGTDRFYAQKEFLRNLADGLP